MKFIDFLIITGFVLTVMTIIVAISVAQLTQTKRILLRLGNYKLEKIRIRLLQSSIGKGSFTGGLPVKADMYFSENLILIAPKEKGYFNGLFNLNLPVILVNDEKQKQEIGLNNIVVPDKINLTTWNSIVIKYQKPLIFNIKYNIQINLLDKNDIKKINKIKNWSQ